MVESTHRHTATAEDLCSVPASVPGRSQDPVTTSPGDLMPLTCAGIYTYVHTPQTDTPGTYT